MHALYRSKLGSRSTWEEASSPASTSQKRRFVRLPKGPTVYDNAAMLASSTVRSISLVDLVFLQRRRDGPAVWWHSVDSWLL